MTMLMLAIEVNYSEPSNASNGMKLRARDTNELVQTEFIHQNEFRTIRPFIQLTFHLWRTETMVFPFAVFEILNIPLPSPIK